MADGTGPDDAEQVAREPEAFRVGDTDILRVFENWYSDLDPRDFFPDWRDRYFEEQRDWVEPAHMTAGGRSMRLSIHSWLVRHRGRRILVDCCCGNCKDRLATRPQWHDRRYPFVENLAAAGAAPDDVDLVINTHLHADHVGWNTRLVDGRWQPTFGRARYLMPRLDWEHQLRIEQDPDSPPAAYGAFADSVVPVVEAGLADFVEAPCRVEDGVELVPMPGHTPGQVAILLRSGGETAIFSADVLHHPLQIVYPELECRAFTDPAAAHASRVRLLNLCADLEAVLFPAHFGAPFAMRIVRHRGGFRPVLPADATQSAFAIPT